MKTLNILTSFRYGLYSLMLNIAHWKKHNRIDLIDLPCLTDSFFFSSAPLFPYAIDINAKMAIEIQAKLIVF